MKAVLVIDMPDSCDKCPLFGETYTDMCCRGLQNRGINYPYPKDFKQDWCPLKEMPEHELVWYDDEGSDWERGRNHCIDKILGDENK